MKKRPQFQPIDVHDWLALSEDGEIAKRIAVDPYCFAYGSLLSHFARLKSVTWDDAVVGLHVVYGWMPTIPKLGGIMAWDSNTKNELTSTLTSAIEGAVPCEARLSRLMAFCNNSMIGASKLLHFLNPALFPIWDSRVAKAFFNRPKAHNQQVNTLRNWKSYQSVLNTWLADKRVVKKCAELRKRAVYLAQVTDLRLVELVLFHKTAPKRTRQNP